MTNHLRLTPNDLRLTTLLFVFTFSLCSAQPQRHYRANNRYGYGNDYISEYSNIKGGFYGISNFFNSNRSYLSDPNIYIGLADSMMMRKEDYKAETYTKYEAMDMDTTFTKRTLSESGITTFNKAGHVLNYTRKDERGRIVDSINHTYNSKNYLVESKWYDSLKRMIYYDKYTWNSRGMLSGFSEMKWKHSMTGTCPGVQKDTVEISRQWSQIAYNHTNKISAIDDSSADVGDPDADTDVMHYRYTYDKDNNLTLISAEKPGFLREKKSEAYTYDNKRRELSDCDYDSTALQHSYIIVYGTDGGRTTTYETYSYATSNGSCTPDHSTVIRRFDSKGDELSGITKTLKDGDTSTNSEIYTYVYAKGKLVTTTRVTTESAYLHSCNSTNITTRTYDADSNCIKETTIGGGEYAGNYTYTYSFNANHKVMEGVTYGSCLDKPMSRNTYSYYPDGTLKEMVDYEGDDGKRKDVYRYDAKGRKVEEISINRYNISQTLYTYEKW